MPVKKTTAPKKEASEEVTLAQALAEEGKTTADIKKPSGKAKTEKNAVFEVLKVIERGLIQKNIIEP